LRLPGRDGILGAGSRVVAQSLSLCIGSWVGCAWLPGRPRRHVGTGSMVRFAASTLCAIFYLLFHEQSRQFSGGMAPWICHLGFYKKAYDLFALPACQLSTSLTIVAVSALSRLRNDWAQYRRYLLGANWGYGVCWHGPRRRPDLGGKRLDFRSLGTEVAGVGPNLHPFGTGHRNHDALLHQCMDSLFHRARRQAVSMGLVDLGTTTLFLVVGLRWGAEGIAVAWVASYWVLAFPGLWYAGQPIKLSISSIISCVWRYILASLLAGGIQLSLCPMFRFLRGRVRLVCGREASCDNFRRVRIPLPRCCHPFAPGIRPLTQFAGLVREMISWKRSANLGSNASPKSNPDFSGASAVLTPAGPGEIA